MSKIHLGLGTSIWKDVFPEKTIRYERDVSGTGEDLQLVKLIFRREMNHFRGTYKYHGLTIYVTYLYKEDAVDFSVKCLFSLVVSVHYSITRESDGDPQSIPFVSINYFLFGEPLLGEFAETLNDIRHICGLLDDLAMEVYEYAKNPARILQMKE